MLSIPRRFDLPIPWGMVRRNAPGPSEAADPGGKSKLSPSELQHLIAYLLCVGAAENFLREATDPREVAMLVLEDVQHMRKYLRDAPGWLRSDPIELGPDGFRKEVSILTPSMAEFGPELRVSKIVDCAHLAAKRDAPLLQLADACAFTIRRWISRQSKGDDLMMIMRQELPVIEDFSGPGMSGCWPPYPMPGEG